MKSGGVPFTADDLADLAWGKSFGRGQDYFRAGRVGPLRAIDHGVTAQVSGALTYRVRLRVRAGVIDHDCTCPVGDDGLFCKHCVAVGLAWRAHGPPAAEGEAADLPGYLAALDHGELVGLLLEQAEQDDRLYRRLATRAARAAGTFDPSVWRGDLDDAVWTDTYLTYTDMPAYAHGISEVIDTLDDLLADGAAATVMDLAEYGLDAVEDALDTGDDSDGYLGDIMDRLRALHHAACQQARPDPADLAARLFERAMDDGFGLFQDAPHAYAEALGAVGLERFRKLVEPAWRELPALGPGDTVRSTSSDRRTITALMESIARATEDTELLMAVLSKDLCHPGDYLRVAEARAAAGQGDEALEWAERGWAAFAGGHRDDRLRAFLVRAYQARGRVDDALALTWSAFDTNPSFDLYLALADDAQRAGRWPDWRARALSRIREPMTDGTISADGTTLVRVLLHDGDTDAAWRAAADHGCMSAVMMELAARRGETHPWDAIEAYRGELDRVLTRTGDAAYAEALNLLDRMRRVMEKADLSEEFISLIAGVRADHRRKRKLLAMMDDRGW